MITTICIGLAALLIAALFTLHAQHKALERGQETIDLLRSRRTLDDETIRHLTTELAETSKNDHRDAKGRFTSLSKSPAKR